MQIGKALRLTRLRQEATQGDVARQAEITRAHLCDIEHGRTQPGWALACRLADALGIGLDELRALAQALARGGEVTLRKPSAAKRPPGRHKKERPDDNHSPTR